MSDIYEKEKWVKQHSYCTLLLMDLTDGYYLFYINNQDKTVNMDYPTLGGVATISTSINHQQHHDYQISMGHDVKVRFENKKGLERLGSSKREELYQRIYSGVEDSGLIPNIPSLNHKAKLEWLMNTLREVMRDDKTRQKVEEHERLWKAEISSENREYFFTEETYGSEIHEHARGVLLTNNVLNKFVDIMELRVVGQRSQLLLKFLAALSTPLSNPLNTIGMGDSSSGKTWTEDTVYELFPTHRKIKLDADTTHNSIMRMTYFREGKHFFKGKWVYLGDMGDEDEFKRAAELMSVIKVLMSEQAYRKGVSEKDESGKIRAEVLTLEGCGHVSMQVVTSRVEAQYGNRTVFWSPLDTKHSRDQIRRYQENIIKSEMKKHAFKKARPVLACAIDKIFKFVEYLERDGASFRIYNPFLAEMGERYNIDKSPNVNRDRLMMEMIPSLVTLANCFNRDVYYNESINQYTLVVTPEDYQFCVDNMGAVLSSFIGKRNMSLFKYVELIEEEIIPSLKDKIRWNHNSLIESIRNDEQILDDIMAFSIADLTPYTNVSDSTIRSKMEDLANLGLIVKDDRKRTNLWYIPQEFEEIKKDIFRDQLPLDKKEPILISNQESNIENIYKDFLVELSDSNYCKTEVLILNTILDEKEDNTGENLKIPTKMAT